MTPERWRQVRAIFDVALECDPALRPELVRQRCGNDEELHKEVASLLASDSETGSLLDIPLKSAGTGASVSPAPMLPARYEILGELGRGGMGIVYKARDRETGEVLALKILKPEIAADLPTIERFKNELRLAHLITHRNVARLYEFHRYGDVVYLSMEYVEGESLRSLLRHTGKLDLARGLDMARQLAAGIAEAHRQSIAHRDLKPENIMLTPGGELKVMDFGICRSYGGDETATGVIMGTPAYMAPEQAEGKPADDRTDIYAFGLILYEMFTGAPAFSAETPVALALKQIRERPQPPRRLVRELPVRVEQAILKCLEKDPSDRFQSVEDLVRALQGEPSPTAWKRGLRPRVLLLVLGGLLLVLAVVSAWYRARFGPLRSLAVLPFTTLSGGSSTEYLGDGLSETILNSVSRIRTLRVLSRNASFRFRGRDVDAQDAGRRLGVMAILTGRVQQRDQEFVVQVELIDVQSNQHIWGHQYSTHLAGLLSVQEEIAQDVADNLRLSLGVEERQRLTRHFTENSDAWQYYLKGRYFWNKRTQEGLRQGIQNFEQAVALDPHYALAYTGLADCYSLQSGLISPREVFPKAKAAAIKALEIDEDLAEAHAALGYIKFNYDWDWLDSEREFKRAIQLNANYPSAHSYYARYLNAMGRFSEAVQQVRAAHDLDPLALGINTGLGQSYYFQRDYDRAIQNYEKTLSLEPTFNMARFNLAAALLQKKLTQRSIKEYETAVKADPNDAGTLCEMGQAYAVAGRTGDARRVLAQVLSMASTRYVSAPFISWIYAGLGEKDDAMRQLEKGYQDRAWPMTFLKVDPRYDSLRPDSRFTDLMRRTGFSVGL